MKVAYVTLFDATDPKNWSGTDRLLWKSLEAQGAEIVLVGNLAHGPSFGRRLRKLWSHHIERRTFLHFWDTDTAKAYGVDVAQRLRSVRADVVVSPTPVPLAYLQCQQPKVLWTDAGYCALSQDYDEFRLANVSSFAAASATAIDRAVARNCDLLLYASSWGADSAIENSGADPRKVAVVPYGANIEVNHSIVDVQEIADRRAREKLNLLFIGVDWHRKGARKAIEVTRCLRARGFNAELKIVGCFPPDGETVPPFCQLLGYVDKTARNGLELMHQLYRESHLLLAPTLAEAYGIVFAEASAFGLPSLTHRVGGVATVVRDGVNGFLFDKTQPCSDWADCALRVLETPGRLRELAASSFAEYQTRLNWNVAGGNAFRLIQQAISAPKCNQDSTASLIASR